MLDIYTFLTVAIISQLIDKPDIGKSIKSYVSQKQETSLQVSIFVIPSGACGACVNDDDIFHITADVNTDIATATSVAKRKSCKVDDETHPE